MIKGTKHNEETKRKIGEANKISLKGRKILLETRNNMSNAKIGHNVSEETRIKIGNSRRGIKHNNEAKNKISMARIGKKLSEETKLKIGNAHKGMKRPIGTGEKISKANKGRKLSEEQRKRIGEIRRGSKQSLETINKISKTMKKVARRGETHPFWKGGITPINYKIRKSREARLWKKAVFERDYYTCQKYGTKCGVLHPHHINNFADYPELRFAIDNGITLSEKAHREFHKKYGQKNNTQEQIKDFIGGKK